MVFKSFNYNTNSLVTDDDKEVKFDRKNIIHVMYVKMFKLMETIATLNSSIEALENGETISDISTDVDDMDGLETYWLDSYFTDDVLEINAAKHDQLCMQVDEIGNWC